jgi:hypothetical protein
VIKLLEVQIVCPLIGPNFLAIDYMSRTSVRFLLWK